MTVPARRMVDFTESATDRSGEDIRCHVRSRLERLVATLKAGGVRIGVDAG
ncbi:hypothetical protein [Methylobacterium aquaticum]|uniref:hypothetical protein n=1 Tax=Methylobacterium aquaticum TaxID=270351 RepID=UPI001933B3F0|nr:hypothetical protein [Methylobacterium aquaticum]